MCVCAQVIKIIIGITIIIVNGQKVSSNKMPTLLNALNYLHIKLYVNQYKSRHKERKKGASKGWGTESRKNEQEN